MISTLLRIIFSVVISTVRASSYMITCFPAVPHLVPVLTYTCCRGTEHQLILWNMYYLAESRWRTVQNCPLCDFSLCSYKVMLVAKNESKRGRDIGVESSLKCPQPSPDRGHIAVKLRQGPGCSQAPHLNSTRATTNNSSQINS